MQRNRSIITSSIISTKNENTNSDFIKKLGKFSRYNLYPNTENGAHTLCKFLNVSKENLVLGSGSESLLRHLFLILDYDSIQILEHSYEMAMFYNQVLLKNIIVNPLSFFNNQFCYCDVESIGGDLLYLVNPHCPTTIEFDQQQICSFSKKFKYVIIDAAYSNPLVHDWPMFHNVIYVNTFSKLGGVPGLRVGYAIGPERLINRLHCLRDCYEITADSLEYINYICEHSDLITEHSNELMKCYDTLKRSHAGFSVARGNFAVFDSLDYFGKRFSVGGVDFVRVTLTDNINHENLRCR